MEQSYETIRELDWQNVLMQEKCTLTPSNDIEKITENTFLLLLSEGKCYFEQI